VVDEPELDDPELDGARTERVDLLAPYYAGPRLGLKPLYEALLAAARGLGEGVKIDLSTSVIVLRRQKDFASFVASPQGDRIYVGLVLPGRPPTHRLGRARDMGWGTRFTHMVMLRYKTDVDHEVRGWLTEASLTA
jgi:hypothetical protein